MSVQVLVASMNQNDYSLINKMNISTDSIIGNQCDKNSIEEIEVNGNKIIYLNFKERGVGLNRNNTLMRANSDFCLIADDDMVYVDNYEQIVESWFKKTNADVVIFNLIEDQPRRYIIKKKTKVGYLNFLRYGTARIAIRLSSIKRNGIYFNQCFGGGTEHRHGEDNIFLTTCLKKKLKIVAVPDYIAKLTEERESTWNLQYDDEYLYDQGILYKTMFKKHWRLFCMIDAIRRHKLYNMSILGTYKKLIKKAKKYRI